MNENDSVQGAVTDGGLVDNTSSGNTTWASIRAAVSTRLGNVKDGFVHFFEKLRDYIQNIKDNNKTEPDYSDLPVSDKLPNEKPDEPTPTADMPDSDEPLDKPVDKPTPTADMPDSEGRSDEPTNDDSSPKVSFGYDENKYKSLMPMSAIDFGDIDTSSMEAYESQHLENMAVIKLAQRHSIADNGETKFDVDDFSERLDSFTKYAAEYARLKKNTHSGIEFDNAVKSLYGMPNYEENNRIMAEIVQEQNDFLEAIRAASDNGAKNNIGIYMKYPTAAFAGGDITYDEYVSYLDDRSGLGADLINDGDEKSNHELTGIMQNDNGYEPLTIRNLARLRFAEGMSKEGAFDMDALDAKMKKFDECVRLNNQSTPQIATDVDPDIQSMYKSCVDDVKKFSEAESAKWKEALKIPVSDGQDATMRYFYEGYADTNLVYAAGKIDRDTYESKLTTNLVGLSSSDFAAYVASKRADQVSDVTPGGSDAALDEIDTNSAPSDEV